MHASLHGLSQARSHYSLWAIMKAVMLLGTDLASVGEETLAIIKNKHALAINQVPAPSWRKGSCTKNWCGGGGGGHGQFP